MAEAGGWPRVIKASATRAHHKAIKTAHRGKQLAHNDRDPEVTASIAKKKRKAQTAQTAETAETEKAGSRSGGSFGPVRAGGTDQANFASPNGGLSCQARTSGPGTGGGS